MRICSSCLAEKEEADFYREGDRLRRICKACDRFRNQRWVDANRKRYRELNLLASRRYRQRDPIARLHDITRRRAAKRGIEFSISVEDIGPWPQHCPVLGIELRSGFGSGTGQLDKAAAPSIDRIDNTKGYVPGNVVIVSWRANRLKSDASPAELRALADFYELGRQGSEKSR